MRPNKLKALWRQGKPGVTGWIFSGNPFIAEVMANAGYDALVIDMQHGLGITPDKAIACLQAISTTDTVPIVRVPWNDPAQIQYVLDGGAYGVIVPLINNAEDAARVAGASRYPPLGFRSAGPGRTRFYGGADYFQHANEEIIVLVMIETQDGLNNLEKIVQVPGIDGLYIGPSDLAVGLGLPPVPESFKDPRHMAAVKRVLDVTNSAGLVPCHHSAGPEDAVRLFDMGFKLSQIGTDVGYISAGAAAALKTVAEARAKAYPAPSARGGAPTRRRRA